MADNVIDPVELLQAALSIPSPSGDERKLADFLVSRMASFAEASVDDSGSAVGKLGTGSLHIMFLGHIDTVPGNIPVRIEGDRLFGRGSVDAKGPFCAAVAAASRLPEAALERLSVTLLGATEEEVPSSKGARYALSHHRRPDLLIIGEPSGWDAITLGYKGRLVLQLEAIKANGHSAGAQSSAPEDVVAIWNLLSGWTEEFNQGRTKLFERLQVSLQEITSFGDGLDQGCRATIGFRLPPDLSPAQARAALSPLLPPGSNRYRFTGDEAPYRGPRDTRLTRAFRSAIRSKGGEPRFKLKTGTSDMNVVAPEWRVPVVAYGPGDSALDHSPNEHVELTDLRRATDVLEAVLLDLAQTPESS